MSKKTIIILLTGILLGVLIACLLIFFTIGKDELENEVEEYKESKQEETMEAAFEQQYGMTFEEAKAEIEEQFLKTQEYVLESENVNDSQIAGYSTINIQTVKEIIKDSDVYIWRNYEENTEILITALDSNTVKGQARLEDDKFIFTVYTTFYYLNYDEEGWYVESKRTY